MKTLFQIQTESGQLWLDIKAQLDAKEAAYAESSADLKAKLSDKDAAHAATVAELQEVKAFVEESNKVVLDPDISDEDTVLALKAQIEAQTLPGRIAAAQADVAAAQARLGELLGK